MTRIQRMQSSQEQTTEDARLISLAQQGDTEAFRALYDRYVRLIYRYIVVRVGSPQAAEDLTAETFIRAWRKLPAFKFQGAPLGDWLLRIAYERVRGWSRSKRERFDWLPRLINSVTLKRPLW